MLKGSIETIAFGGNGIMRHDGYVIFIPFTAPGDQVTANLIHKKKHHGIGKLQTIDYPSPLRTTPSCPFFGTCGGCQLQHITYTAQLEIKRTFVQDALERIAKVSVIVPPLSPAENPWNYRRHIRLNIRGNSAGYIATDQHTLTTVDQCPIFISHKDSPILEQIQSFLSQFDPTDFEEASLKVFKQNNHQFLLVFTFGKIIPKQAEHLAQIALKSYPNWEGVILHSPTCTHTFGNTECSVDILGLSMSFSPFGFIQNHPEQSQKLYTSILDAIPPEAGKVLDLFCGIGTTSLLMAQRGAEVIGIELHQDTVELAKQNAQQNGINNVTFMSGKAEKITRGLIENFKPDCVLCNPPRIGLDQSLVQTLINARPKYLLYVSCMPATLARDIRFFIDAGYQLERVQAFDMFPQTTHVETLISLRLHQN